jgi:hypothetical protein
MRGLRDAIVERGAGALRDDATALLIDGAGRPDPRCYVRPCWPSNER